MLLSAIDVETFGCVWAQFHCLFCSIQVHQQLQELPEQWNNTKKIAITVKQVVAPLQTNEVANIRRKTASFDVQQHTFREQFRAIGPFFYECPDSYEQLDEQHITIHSMEKEMIALNESAALFEVNSFSVYCVFKKVFSACGFKLSERRAPPAYV